MFSGHLALFAVHVQTVLPTNAVLRRLTKHRLWCNGRSPRPPLWQQLQGGCRATPLRATSPCEASPYVWLWTTNQTAAKKHLLRNMYHISSCRHWMSRLPGGTSVEVQHTAKIMRNSKASLQITPQRPAKAGCVAIEAQRGPQCPVSFPHHGMINMSLRCKKRPTFQHFRATNDRPILWIDFHATPVCPTQAARRKRRTCNWATQGQTQVRLGSFGLLLPRSRDLKLMA